MNNNSYICAFTMLLLCNASVLAQGPGPGGHPVIRQETSSVAISLVQKPMTEVIAHIDSVTKKIQPDWDAIDLRIINWFESKKMQENWRNHLVAAPGNALLESTKQKARADVKRMIEAWNTCVTDSSAGCKGAIELLWKSAPYGDVWGVYSYSEGSRDPGFPGWSTKKEVIWGNLHHVNDFFKTGLEEVAIKVAASTDVELAKLSGEIITKVSSSLKIAYTADLRLTEPFPPDPLNKPIAETGFVAFLDWTFSITSEVKVLIILGGDLNRGITIKLGEYQKNIEAKRFKAPNDP